MPQDQGSPKPRSLDEIQKAHDVLASLTEDNILPGLPGETLDMMDTCRDVLCWILGHKSEFGWRLENTIRLLEKNGFVFSKMNNPKTS